MVHLCLCVWYGGFPIAWEWWAVNAMSLVLMALLGEFLCMRREMQAALDPPPQRRAVIIARISFAPSSSCVPPLSCCAQDIPIFGLRSK